jgi:nitrous oxide reductase accessory protein NosL
MKHALAFLAAALLVGLTAGCSDQNTAKPAPLEITQDAQAEFCGMTLAEHPGPKGQLFLRGQDRPFWFASVRDTFAFTMLPEMPKNIAAIYVNDMGRARNWATPEAGTWVEARKAVYVIGSRHRTGMDTDEAVPFGDPAVARQFAAENGGRVVSYQDMPHDYIFPEQGHGS